MALRFCPRNIARTKNKCGGHYENFWLIKPSECFSRTDHQFCQGQANGCAVCSTVQTVNHEWTRIDTKKVVNWKDRESNGIRLWRIGIAISAVDSFFAHDLRTAVCAWRTGGGRKWLAVVETFCSWWSRAWSSARTAAMLFNRLVDWSLDQRNPRTASRHLLVSKRAVQMFLVLSSGGFVAAASAINRLTFILAPVALALSFFLLSHQAVYQRNALFSRTGAGHRTGGRMDRADRTDRSCTACSRGRRYLLGRWLRSDLRDAGLRFRSARRNSVAGGEPRNRAQPASGAAIASSDVRCADRVSVSLRNLARFITGRCR